MNENKESGVLPNRQESYETENLASLKLIDLVSPPISGVLGTLLKDKTTGNNIIWATDTYSSQGSCFEKRQPITVDLLLASNHADIISRSEKEQDDQQERTRLRGEVFTPVWVCNLMNNYCDEEWLGHPDSFNLQNENGNWEVTSKAIEFSGDRDWKKYVDSRRLEITCGEAPFLASRYDASQGKLIVPPDHRVGILDRKLRIVSENTGSLEEWTEWAIRAVQSCYGYEWQGDNLLIARANIFLTFYEHYVHRWGFEPESKTLESVANIIAWNLWQMNGLTGTVPYSELIQFRQMTLFDSENETRGPETGSAPCKIFDWRSKESVQFIKNYKRGKMGKKLFDFIIGNPPYQEMNDTNGRQPPVYHKFMDAAFDASDHVLLITPARFLFDTGQTPKEWNHKMLNDPHFKVILYEKDSKTVFPNAEIKGGIAISYHDSNQNFGIIGTFTPYPELNSILRKVLIKEKNKPMFDTLVSSQGICKFSGNMLAEHPEALDVVGAGTGNKIISAVVELLPDVFICDDSCDSENYVKVLAKGDKGRIVRYIRREYLIPNPYIDTYNVLVPESNGSGAFETFSSPIIAEPGMTHTDTFLSIGTFNNEIEAGSCLKYIKTKFVRALLGVKKATQHNPKSTWIYVPLQDFTQDSDIQWTDSTSYIDKQLYEKYALSKDEIDFIESNVKKME